MSENKAHYEEIPKHKELEGKVALITGGSSGIGRATAIRFTQCGAKVAILARSKDGLEETCNRAKNSEGKQVCLPIICDVTRENEQIEAFVRTIEAFGHIDIVVANAGSFKNAPIQDTSLELWQEMIDVVATGYFLTAREAFRHWLGQKIRGSLVFVTSKNAVAPSPGASAYAAAKAASQHLARTLAEEGGPKGIRTNIVLPDAVIRGTNILSSEQRKKTAARHDVDPDNLEEYFKKRNALKVEITPEDVAESILFLAGPRGQKLNGVAITVDGGMAVAYLR